MGALSWVALLIHGYVAMRVYASWPYDQLCSADNSKNVYYKSEDSRNWTKCDKSFDPTAIALNSQPWMSATQQSLVELYACIFVGMLSIGLAYLVLFK